jgi:hypothetical protein
MFEEWKTIEESGAYEVSSLGQVRRIGSSGTLKPWRERHGYLQVGIPINGKFKHRRIHNLVANTFLTKHESDECVNHKDGIKANNCAENLEFTTYSGNNIHALRMGLTTRRRGESCTQTKLTKATVCLIHRMANEGILTNEEMGKLFKISDSTISQIKNGKRWQHLGLAKVA